uniref:Cadherin domain-containing protein n=1 Tax=Stegastes partitus TaxID=144197 RepID=A0A3B4Z7P3_9TELE
MLPKLSLGLVASLGLFLVLSQTAFGDVSFSVPEEMKQGSVVGNIAKEIGLDVGKLAARKARINTDGSSKRYCDINLNTGDIIVTDRIDREALCGKKASCVLKQELVLENPLELHRITVHVQDINDNSPQFKKKTIKFEIRESANKGSRYRLDEAHDADVGQNAVQGYNIEANENFRINVVAKSGGGKYSELVLEKELDREQQQELTIVLAATDGGTPQRSGTAVIHVTVLDANDNAPVFSQAVYKASLPENSPLDTVVVTVSATDADEGINGDVTYEFDHISDENNNLFSLDHKTGEISVTGDIDYEEGSKYEVVVEAKDGYGLSSEAKVIIDITDVNDNAPVIYLKSLTNPIPENVSPGTEVGIINVQDRDSENNRQVRCSIQQNNFILGVETNSVELVLNKELDRESLKEINLLLTALDGGSPPMSGTVVIHITVLDANDNVPVFSQAVYKVSLPENAVLGTIVATVSAADADEGLNGEVTYDFGHISEDVKSIFSIDHKTGDVKLMTAVDFETVASFELRVTAKDGLGLTSYAKVIIDVTDVNDNAPAIFLKSLTNPIPENVSPGTEVGIINVQDRDSENNGQVRCSIQQNVPFKLVPSIKNYYSLVSTGQLDRENLIVSVRDNGQPSLSATCSMYLLISDNLAEVPELKDIAYDDKNSKLTSYLIIALVSVSTFFLTFIIIILGVRFCRRRKPRLLFDGAVAIPSAYLPPNYADVDGTGTLRSTYNYDAYLTTGSRTSDFKFVTSYNDNTLPADQTLRKSPSDFVDAFGDCESSPEVGTAVAYNLNYSVF